MRRGWGVTFVIDRNRNEEIRKFDAIEMDLHSEGSEQAFYALMHKLVPSCVEFQCCRPDFFNRIDLEKLHGITVGVCLHDQADIRRERIESLDYSYKTANSKTQFTYVRTIRNWIDRQERCWRHAGQKKAVLISRIHADKLPTIINFARVCDAFGIGYEIFGNATASAAEALLEHGISRAKIHPPVETIAFLKEHWEEYLFVGGVGQVIMEAASLGYPVMVSPHTDFKKATFVTQSNIDFLAFWNFVIHHCPDDQLGNYQEFFSHVSERNLDEYDVYDIISKDYTEEILNGYEGMLNDAMMSR